MTRVRTGRTSLARRAALLVGVVLLGSSVIPEVSAAFTSSTGSASTFTAAAHFTTYPEAVMADSPWMYHRSDDSPSSAATSAAYNTAVPARPGTYNGTTDGTSIPVAGAKLRWNFDAGSGTTVVDSVGTNNGTMGGSVAWAPGHNTSSAGFPASRATTNYVQSASKVLTSTTTQFTLMAWVRLDHGGAVGTRPPSQTVLSLNHTDGTGFNAGALRYDTTDDKWHFSMTTAKSGVSAAGDAVSMNVAEYNTWTHLAVLHEVGPMGERKLKVFVDGADPGPGNEATIASSWDCTDCKLNLGRRLENGAWVGGFAGGIDDVSVFDTKIGPAEIKKEANGLAFVAGQPGALQGPVQGLQSSTAVRFNGPGEGPEGAKRNAYNNTTMAAPGPTAFTLECWFRSSDTDGGSLIGMGTNATDAGPGGGTPDRVLYVDSGGNISFLVAPSSVNTAIRSPDTYEDGQWHHVAASIGSAGMKLYLDGALVATNANQNALTLAAAGYWRWGGSRLDGTPNKPTSGVFTGVLDEVAVYHTQLSDARIAAHYDANF